MFWVDVIADYLANAANAATGNTRVQFISNPPDRLFTREQSLSRII